MSKDRAEETVDGNEFIEGFRKNGDWKIFFKAQKYLSTVCEKLHSSLSRKESAPYVKSNRFLADLINLALELAFTTHKSKKEEIEHLRRFKLNLQNLIAKNRSNHGNKTPS